MPIRLEKWILRFSMPAGIVAAVLLFPVSGAAAEWNDGILSADALHSISMAKNDLLAGCPEHVRGRLGRLRLSRNEDTTEAEWFIAHADESKFWMKKLLLAGSLEYWNTSTIFAQMGDPEFPFVLAYAARLQEGSYGNLPRDPDTAFQHASADQIRNLIRYYGDGADGGASYLVRLLIARDRADERDLLRDYIRLTERLPFSEYQTLDIDISRDTDLMEALAARWQVIGSENSAYYIRNSLHPLAVLIRAAAWNQSGQYLRNEGEDAIVWNHLSESEVRLLEDADDTRILPLICGSAGRHRHYPDNGEFYRSLPPDSDAAEKYWSIARGRSSWFTRRAIVISAAELLDTPQARALARIVLQSAETDPRVISAAFQCIRKPEDQFIETLEEYSRNTDAYLAAEALRALTRIRAGRRVFSIATRYYIGHPSPFMRAVARDLLLSLLPDDDAATALLSGMRWDLIRETGPTTFWGNSAIQAALDADRGRHPELTGALIEMLTTELETSTFHVEDTPSLTPTLVALRAHPFPLVRHQAALLLAAYGPDSERIKVLDEAIAALEHEKFTTSYYRAVTLLKTYAGPRQVERLADMLRTYPDSPYSSIVMDILSARGGETSIRAFVRIIADTGSPLYISALRALHAQNNTPCSELARAALADAAYFGPREFADEAMAMLLRTYADDVEGREQLLLRAIRSQGRFPPVTIADIAAIGFSIEYMNDFQRLRIGMPNYPISYDARTWDPIPLLHSEFHDSPQEKRALLARVLMLLGDPRSIVELRSHLSDEEPALKFAIWSSFSELKRKHKAPDSYPPIRDSGAEFARFLPPDFHDYIMREQVLSLVADLRSPSALGYVERLVNTWKGRDGSTLHVEVAYLKSLSPDPRALRLLVRFTGKDLHGTTQSHAISALADLDRLDLVASRLAEIFARGHSEDNSLLMTVLGALKKEHGMVWGESVLALLVPANEYFWSAAADALSRMSFPGKGARLLQLFRGEQGAGVIAFSGALIQAASTLSDSDEIALITLALRNDNIMLRSTAWNALDLRLQYGRYNSSIRTIVDFMKSADEDFRATARDHIQRYCRGWTREERVEWAESLTDEERNMLGLIRDYFIEYRRQPPRSSASQALPGGIY